MIDEVTVSLLHLVGGAGILAALPLPLTGEESDALAVSAQLIRRAIDSVETSK